MYMQHVFKNICSINELMEDMVYMIDQRTQVGRKERKARIEAMHQRSWEDQGTRGQEDKLKISLRFNISEGVEKEEDNNKGAMMRESI